MDQDSFRKLLQSSQPGVSASDSDTTSRGSLLASTSKPKVKPDHSQPAFKPRKVKKEKESTYRDRASERRLGAGNDYAHVEALLKDFEHQRANDDDKAAVEEQRRYLGGDGDHSILVKGLDFALMEQNKARAALSTGVDDSLEKIFLEESSRPQPKKRSREEYIQQLKEMKTKRNGETVNGESTKMEDEVQSMERAKNTGKFKPIGFKPISAPVEEKPKRKKNRDKGKDGEFKAKKRKIEEKNDEGARTIRAEDLSPLPSPRSKSMDPIPSAVTAEPESEPINDDFDIFADAGEYQGIDLGDDDDDSEDGGARPPKENGSRPTEPTITPAQWFSTESASPPPLHRTDLPREGSSLKPNVPLLDPAPAEEEDSEQPLRLMPLESSVLPSIKEFLAMDDAVEELEKRKRRKEKRKGGKGGEEKKLTAEVKADKDYKQLKAYTEKKAGLSGSK